MNRNQQRSLPIKIPLKPSTISHKKPQVRGNRTTVSGFISLRISIFTFSTKVISLDTGDIVLHYISLQLIREGKRGLLKLVNSRRPVVTLSGRPLPPW